MDLYNTFCGYPLEIVNKMPKKELAEELLFVNAIRDNTIDPIKDEFENVLEERMKKGKAKRMEQGRR
ncbi:hypothetical protein JHK82_027546 [Glycine max]|nr:hypothetical protein JHK85_028173 [Glycine max]KAG5126711.1 hypothetical protein JHK82_027546 [Glycine max]